MGREAAEDGPAAKAIRYRSVTLMRTGWPLRRTTACSVGGALQLRVQGHQAGQAVDHRAVDLGEDVAGLQPGIGEQAALGNAGEGEARRPGRRPSRAPPWSRRGCAAPPGRGGAPPRAAPSRGCPGGALSRGAAAGAGARRSGGAGHAYRQVAARPSARRSPRSPIRDRRGRPSPPPKRRLAQGGHAGAVRRAQHRHRAEGIAAHDDADDCRSGRSGGERGPAEERASPSVSLVYAASRAPRSAHARVASMARPFALPPPSSEPAPGWKRAVSSRSFSAPGRDACSWWPSAVLASGSSLPLPRASPSDRDRHRLGARRLSGSSGWRATSCRALLWRIRTKLILSYLFIALVPVLLLTLLFFLAGGSRRALRGRPSRGRADGRDRPLLDAPRRRWRSRAAERRPRPPRPPSRCASGLTRAPSRSRVHASPARARGRALGRCARAPCPTGGSSPTSRASRATAETATCLRTVVRAAATAPSSSTCPSTPRSIAPLEERSGIHVLGRARSRATTRTSGAP